MENPDRLFSETPAPTPEQQCVLDALMAFVRSNDNAFVLKGAAGSGKTFLLGRFCNALATTNTHFRILAPTGRAARILTNKTGWPARTIQSAIFTKPRIIEDASGESVYFQFPLAPNKDPFPIVYVIDEASLLSDLQTEKDDNYLRFGSGRLLLDLITFAQAGRPDLSHTHFVFVGDPAQLAPVGSPFSAALDEAHLTAEHHLRVRSANLTTVVRQKAGSDILASATAIREAIDNSLFNELRLVESEEIQQVTPQDAASTFAETTRGSTHTATVLITHSNHEAQQYNRHIRTILYENHHVHLVPGERLIVTQNNYTHRLMNGDFVWLESASPTTETRTPLRNIELYFRDVVVRMEGGLATIECKLLENHLMSEAGAPVKEIIQALWVDFKKRYKHLKPSDPEFAHALHIDPYFNALRLKYGYAITCYKAQGGEWRNAVVVFDQQRGRQNEEFFRWTYTAITRARERLYLVNAPDFTPYSEMNFGEPIAGEPGGTTKALQLSSAPEHLFEEAGYSVQVQELNYRRRLIVSNGTSSVTVDLVYNGKGIFTSVQINSGATGATDPSFDESVRRIAEGCKNRSAHIAHPPAALPAAPLEFSFLEDQPHLEAFYRHLMEKLEGTGIIITHLIHQQWAERYTFRCGDEAFEVLFHYNGKGQFKNTKLLGNSESPCFSRIKDLLRSP